MFTPPPIIRIRDFKPKLVRGFTIIELVVAVSITAIILGIIYSSYFGTVKTMEVSRARVKNYKLASIVLDKLGGDLSGVYFVERDKQTKFQGHADKLAFVSTNCLGFQEQKDLCTIEYLLNKDKSPGDGFGLLRKQDDATFSFGDYFPGLRFTYYNGKTWQEKWDSDWMGRLPKAVEVEFLLDIEGSKPKKFSSIFNLSLARR